MGGSDNSISLSFDEAVSKLRTTVEQSTASALRTMSPYTLQQMEEILANLVADPERPIESKDIKRLIYLFAYDRLSQQIGMRTRGKKMRAFQSLYKPPRLSRGRRTPAKNEETKTDTEGKA